MSANDRKHTETDTGLSGASPGIRPVFEVELNGINAVDRTEHRGRPSELFWPWFAANVSVLGISYGSFLLGFGISFWQATIVGLVGIVLSFALCGFVALAGKRGHAPTMTLSRAVFGVDGNRVPSALSWLLTVGWETVLASLAVLATATVFTELGWDGGALTQVVALVVVAGLIVLGGVFGFDLIMRLQKWITIVTGLLTVVYVFLVVDHIDFPAIAAIPAGDTPHVIGALVFMMTGFGLGWVQAAADYSRYLPRSASSRGVVGWTTAGASLAPVVLLLFGLLLAGSSSDLSAAIAVDPIGALTTILPVWFLVPFALVAVLGLIGGAVLDIYSSGLALLAAGLRVPRFAAAGIDGVIMVLGAIYVVFFAGSFLGPFQGFLITLGVPVAAWCGIFLADFALRRSGYDAAGLLDPRGRYGSVRVGALALLVLGSVVGWGLVTNGFADWLAWQGYLLDPLGLGGRTGDWAFANLGVLVALVIGFCGMLLVGRGAVRAQERQPV
ncbi:MULTISPECIES: purine-cytosine permease family protein [unclassified Cryobacterium]|uniref:purine-cytosine permease family protein n=1 Tax=unclassified Cryobacterium TaxID=2649013 RepID=UPI002AB36B00|nr:MULTISPECIES: cytosine permease [unclassified Cryobacterium]MDY7529565.1 cytosine permease [Cryobacterium sp. 10C2]MDY7558291.1 cytosine permease [Cryobacterium sp. 10C3]MEB0200841.1 cytosine permease [Cryobacterium sp. 5I3]MEB0290103.1 cytosine permease [Cryobacterium sp. 10C2]